MSRITSACILWTFWQQRNCIRCIIKNVYMWSQHQEGLQKKERGWLSDLQRRKQAEVLYIKKMSCILYSTRKRLKFDLYSHHSTFGITVIVNILKIVDLYSRSYNSRTIIASLDNQCEHCTIKNNYLMTEMKYEPVSLNSCLNEAQ